MCSIKYVCMYVCMYILSLVLLLNIQKYLREKEREVTPPTIHTVISSVKLHWNLGIFNFVLRLRLQIEYDDNVISGKAFKIYKSNSYNFCDCLDDINEFINNEIFYLKICLKAEEVVSIFIIFVGLLAYCNALISFCSRRMYQGNAEYQCSISAM